MIRRAEQQKLMQVFLWMVIVLQAFIMTPQICQALCATVKIQINQELTLERQAFDAHMRINNGLASMPIENVAVTVNFADEEGNSIDPDDAAALFFIRVDTMDNIEDVDGTGSVAPETSADIHWLIMPVPGASNGLESGTLYFVGATLSYTAGGVSETIEVTPDYIYVKPMPQLVLDYFLPTDVYGDDAWTDDTEEPVPFYLGLRVSNKGYGWARALKVESAQPKIKAQPEIVENELGAIIGFQIIGTSVNGQAAQNSLLADFGDISPSSAGVARWVMTCTQSGQFTDFTAEFSHADELGGKLTSLINQEDVRTHLLVHNVLVDVDGRDAIEDFLANDEEVYRVFESDNLEFEVTNQTESASLSLQVDGHRLSLPATQGFVYARVADPYNGSMLIEKAMRSDGKRIKSANVWLSKTRTGRDPWQYYLNIFDHNTPGAYTINFQRPADLPQAPVIALIPDRSCVERETISFKVEASDPDHTIPALSAERLPLRAVFTDQEDGTAVFSWPTTTGQAGRYTIRFIATDGVLESSRQVVLRVFSVTDTDGDGMRDDWEMEHFGTLERDGTGDYDNDGILDLEEFLNGSDPGVFQSVPSVPEILYPEVGEHIDQLSVELEVLNSIDLEGDEYTYTFEVYTDDTYENLLAAQDDVTAQTTTTIWTVPVTLTDNSNYYWRVRAFDATGGSDWAYGEFFTNTTNDDPTAPGISSPADGVDVDTLTPTLEITNATDPDGELITYTFEIYADITMSTLVTSVVDVPAGENLRTAWIVDSPLEEATPYYWRAIAVDPQGATASSALSFFHVNTANAAPPAPEIVYPLNDTEVLSDYVEFTITNVTDPEGDNVTYMFEMDTDAGFTGDSKITSGPVAPMDPDTTWLQDSLIENTQYYWRVKSSDGNTQSAWTHGTFLVNQYNEPPGQATLKHPATDAWVTTGTPLIAVHSLKDPDQDTLFYRFELYSDPELTQPAGYIESEQPQWSSVSELTSGNWYYWRAQAVDQHGLPGPWSETARFFVAQNGVNLPPQLSFTAPDTAITTNAQDIHISWSDNDPDSNAVIALYYDTDDSGADGTLIVENIPEDPDNGDDSYTWDTLGLQGTYYLYAVIEDESSQQVIYCQAAITLTDTTDDADGDGLTDTQEQTGCTMIDDADTDDDGIPDGDEDANRNGILDSGETDPCNADSDGDGIQDGTEIGLTTADIGPDTDTDFFIPDADPTTTTIPTNPDTDGDWLTDGEEDSDANGAANGTETSAAEADTDGDTLSDGMEYAFDMDPLTPDTGFEATYNLTGQDLVITGPINGAHLYYSSQGMVFQDAEVEAGADVRALSNNEMRLKPGTHIKSGARFIGRKIDGQ